MIWYDMILFYLLWFFFRMFMPSVEMALISLFLWQSGWSHRSQSVTSIHQTKLQRRDWWYMIYFDIIWYDLILLYFQWFYMILFTCQIDGLRFVSRFVTIVTQSDDTYGRTGGKGWVRLVSCWPIHQIPRNRRIHYRFPGTITFIIDSGRWLHVVLDI